MFNLFKRKEPETEKRNAGGYTAQIIGAREAWIAGRDGVADTTATVQGCISLWENALAASDVIGADLVTRRDMALAARSLALRGEAVFLIREDGLRPCGDWEFTSANGRPRAYRVTTWESGGATSQTVLAGEVLHFVIGADPVAPYYGTAPLRRAPLSAGMLHTLETALAETYANAPLGSHIVPFPESPETDLETLARGFRGRRGRVMLRESVNVAAAGGVAPQTDWRPASLSPNLADTMATQSWQAARGGILNAFGVLPALLSENTTGPLIREAQRHLAGWTLQPIAQVMAEECSAKLGSKVEIDVMRPVQAFDVGGRARALSTIIEAMARAKEAGLSAQEFDVAAKLVNWGNDDGAH
jgi:hypothetical protein